MSDALTLNQRVVIDIDPVTNDYTVDFNYVTLGKIHAVCKDIVDKIESGKILENPNITSFDSI